MNQDQLEKVISDLGVDKIKRRGNWLMGCCPIHREKHPSWGINLDPPHTSNCFSCGHQSITVSHLIAEIKRIPLDKARELVNDKTAGEFQLPRNKVIKRYGEVVDKRPKKERLYLAPFKVGKETHDYFFDRGFTVETAKLFSIGWDKKQQRIIIPDYYKDGTLLGVIGRTVKKNVEPRYTFYDEYKKSLTLYPEDKVDMNLGWFIIVEGTFDAMWMHQLGFTNTLAIKGSKISKEQCDWLAKYADYVVSFLDNDEAGLSGEKKLIKNMRKRGVDTYKVKYPKGKSDPQELKKFQVKLMLKSKKIWYSKTIDRIS